MTSRLQPGLVLADSQLEREANTYLQRRLIIFYGVSLILAVTLYVVGIPLLAWTDGWTRALLLAPDKLVHLAAILGTAAVLGLLRRRTFRANTLVLLDALGLYIAIAACAIIYSLVYRMAPHSISGILGLFIVARAVVVPCSARTTFLLSAPATLSILIPQLAHGTVYADVDVEYPPEQYPVVIIWHQITVWMAVWIAAIASKINFGLRHQVRKAEQLGQYRLEERIGKGGMGEVFRARHAMLRRPTAVKLIHPDTTDPELFRRFEREVRQTSRLSHPNTISIFDYGRTPEGVFYYAMEYLDGADLREIVEKTGPMPPARVIHILTGISVYDAKSGADFIGHHLHTPPVPLRERLPSVPRDLEAAVHRCLEKVPGKRFADANELREALAACKDAGLWTQGEAVEWWRQLEAA